MGKMDRGPTSPPPPELFSVVERVASAGAVLLAISTEQGCVNDIANALVFTVWTQRNEQLVPLCDKHDQKIRNLYPEIPRRTAQIISRSVFGYACAQYIPMSSLLRALP